MSKKISFPIAIVIIIVCAVLVGGLVVWQYFGIPKGEEEISKRKASEELPETKSPDKKTFDDKNCDELEKEIKNLLEEVNYCENDSDCAFDGGYDCPFGCYKFFNKNVDLQEIDDKVKIFRENNCNFCEYECIRIYDAKCINNKCVGIKYQN